MNKTFFYFGKIGKKGPSRADEIGERNYGKKEEKTQGKSNETSSCSGQDFQRRGFYLKTGEDYFQSLLLKK